MPCVRIHFTVPVRYKTNGGKKMKKIAAFMLLCCSIAFFAFANGKKDDMMTDSDAEVTLSVYMQQDLANPQSAYWPVTVEAFQKSILTSNWNLNMLAVKPFTINFK